MKFLLFLVAFHLLVMNLNVASNSTNDNVTSNTNPASYSDTVKFDASKKLPSMINISGNPSKTIDGLLTANSTTAANTTRIKLTDDAIKGI